jgi:hypothetical protein
MLRIRIAINPDFFITLTNISLLYFVLNEFGVMNSIGRDFYGGYSSTPEG